MHLDLRPGCRVLYQGAIGKVEEFPRHDSALVRLEDSTGLVEVSRASLIPLSSPDKTLDKTELATVEEVVWAKASMRAKAVREIIAVTTGRTVLVKEKALELKISERQVWRLVTDYQRHELVSGMIARVGGRPRGTTVLDPEVERIIAERFESDYLQPERPTCRALYERIAADCRDKCKKPPSETTTRSRINALMGREGMRRREGSKKAKYQYAPMPGHVDAAKPLDRVEIDHTPLDVFARSDDSMCDYIGRPWLTVAIDVCTRCVGFYPASTDTSE